MSNTPANKKQAPVRAIPMAGWTFTCIQAEKGKTPSVTNAGFFFFRFDPVTLAGVKGPESRRSCITSSYPFSDLVGLSSYSQLD